MALKEEKVELLRRVDIFAEMREYELDVIANYSEFVTFGKGDLIFPQGAAADSFFVLEKGRVGIISVESSSDAVIAQIAAGESFGELDFFGFSERSASAFSDEDSLMLRFPAAGIKPEKLFAEHDYLFARILYTLLGSVSERIWNVNRLLHGKTGWLLDLHKQLLCDKMTGLYNQTFLKEDFVSLLPDMGESAAFIMIKPDNFKDINDRFGHEAGDSVLNLMAIFLQSELGENDIGVRYRGDEYAAILVSSGRESSLRRAGNIRKAFTELDISGITGESGIKLSVSIGVAVYPDDSDNSAGLVSAAYKKMMLARESGGNMIVM